MKRAALLSLVLWAASAGFAADTVKPTPNSPSVLPARHRLEALANATNVLAPREVTWKTKTADLPDPFFRATFVPDQAKPEVEPEPQKPERSDLELLEQAANTLNPTGTMMVDGENYLLLGGRRHKVGAMLPIAIDGIRYEIILSSIEGKSYTLRLNETELRRQLK